MTTFPKKIVEKLQVVPGGVTNLVKKGGYNFRPDVPPPQPPDNGSGDGFVFSTHNNDPVAGELPIMVMAVALDNSWKLVDADTGTLVADGLGNRVDGVEIQQSGPGESEPGIPNANEVLVTLTQTGSRDKKYRLTGNIMMMGLGGLSQMSPGPATMPVSEGSVGQVIVHQWLARVVQCVFSLADINLQVPRHLSPDIVSTQHMFALCNLFNQDISTWNTSRVTVMATMFQNATSFNQDISGWDVSNVTNMDSMFESASQFNQDLSPWCVKNILRKPDKFDNQASRWAKSRPSWGTCPAEEEEPPYVPPVEEEVDDDTVIKAFDYALIRYRWTPTGGENLDTRTYLSKPNRSGRKVGRKRLKNDNSYLIWNEDNTRSGVESVLIDIDKIHVDYPGEQIIELKMDGFWYSQVKSGKLDIEFATFKGGKMVASGYDWINEGGLAIQILKLGVDTLVQQPSDIEGENLATLHYDTLLKKGTLVARDGPSIGDGGTVEPEVPVIPPEGGGNGPGGIVDPTNPVYPDSEQGFTFSVEIRDNEGGSVPFDIRLVKVAPGWKVYSGNTLILSADKIHPQVSANVSMGDVTLTFNIPRKDIKTYTIIADAPSLAFEVTQTNFSGQDIVINRFSNTILNYQFSVTDATLRVPTVLPSYITSTSNMFLGADQFNQDISMWDTSNVTNMSGMFDNAETFNQDISGWDVSNVTNMMFMFRYAHKFNQPIGSWNVQNATNMKSMFESAPVFNQDLSKWCVRKIATKPDRFDYSAHSLYSSHLPVWGTCPVTYPPGVPLEFNLTTPADSTQTAPLTFELEEWGTGWALYEDDVLISNSETMGPGVSHSMGGFNRQIIKIDRDNFANKTVNYKMFVNNKHLNVSRGFNESSSIYPSVEVLSFSDTSRRQSLRFAWTDMTVPTALPQNINSTVTMFDGCQRFNQDISMWDTSYVENMGVMFRNCISFNQPIGGWDVRNVTDLSDMFAGCSSFNQDISGWDVSQVKRIQGTFQDATVFNSDISGWNLDSAIDYQNAFKNAIAFNQDISGWKTSNVLNMSQMFSGSHSFNQDISKWDVKQVQNMKEMFYDARSFNQDLSGWCVTNITSKPNLFSEGAVAWSKPKPIWGTTGGSNPPSGVTPFSFTTSNRMASAPLPVALRVVSSGQAWSLIDAETKVVIHEAAEGNTPGETKVLYLDELGSGAERSYVIEGTASEVSLSIDDESRSDGFIKVESFSGDINQYKYDVKNADITVPLLLPDNVTNTDFMFQGCYNFNQDITGWDTSAITSMEGMFSGCTSFNQEIGNWDVSNVTNMNSMFKGCVIFNGDISSWETHALENMYAMFSDCEAFNQNLNDWDVSNVTDMGMLFSNCRVFNQPLDNWDTSSCVVFGSCFAGAHVFNQNINNWDVTNANDLNHVFSDARAFNQPLSNWVIPKLYTLESTFTNATSFNQDISNWNVSMVSDMSYMFQGATAFNKPLNSWDTSSLKYANGMFDGAHNFNQPLDNWVTSSLSRMSTMFSEATSFNQDLSSWCVTNFDAAPHNFSSGCLDWVESKPIWGTCDDEPARTFNFTFTSGSSVATRAKIRLLIRNLQGGWELYRNGVLVSSRTVTDARVVATPSSYAGLAILIEPVASSVENYELKLTADALELGYTANDGNNHSLAVTQFSNGIAINEFALYKVALTVPETLPTYVKSLAGMFRGSDNFNQNINAWDVSHIKEFTECFKDCTKFNQPLDTWTMTGSSPVVSMFENCTAFNQDISSWDVTGKARLLKMFSGCTNFNQSLDAWDVSNVWSFESMFSQCSSLNQDFTNWAINTSTKVNMYSMFSGCTVFNGDINTWDMSMVGKTERMFTGCNAFNRDISGWNTVNFSNMEYMFQNAISFNQDLSPWNVVKFRTMPYEFASNTPAWTLPKPVWGTAGTTVLA